MEDNLESLPDSRGLVNGLMYELGLFRKKHNIDWKTVEKWVTTICESFLPFVTFNLPNLRGSIERLLKKVSDMKRNKKDWAVFLELPYNLPRTQASKASQIVDDSKELASDFDQAKRELEEEKSVLSKKLLREKRRCKNRYKQMKRRDDRIQQQQRQILSLSDVLASKEKLCAAQQKQCVNALAAKERYRAKVNYGRKIVAQTKANLHYELQELREDFNTNLENLEHAIKAKEESNDQLLLENEELLLKAKSKQKIPTFDAGKFNDSIRQCCIELLSLNVGVRNVEPIIRSVVCNVVGVDVDRLPKYSTLVGMLSEMKVIAYEQLSDELVGQDYTTLHSDGTTKFGQHYGSFQVSTEGSAYSLGLMEMSSGSAKHALDSLKEILSDIDAASNGNAGRKILTNIKNTMSDRHVVEKSFNTLLEGYRSEVLPSIYEGWENLSTSEKKKISSLNSFFCGMHLVVGMADTAATTLKEWENIHFESPQGASTLPKVFTKNEAGMVHMLARAS